MLVILLKLKKKKKKKERETLKEEKETTNVEIRLHKGEVDFTCQKSSFICDALGHTSKMIVNTEFVLFLCLVFKHEHWTSFHPSFINSTWSWHLPIS